MELLQADDVSVGEVVREGRSEVHPPLFGCCCHGAVVAFVVAAPAGVLVLEVAVDEFAYVVGV